jgi:hypothetical protein
MMKNVSLLVAATMVTFGAGAAHAEAGKWSGRIVGGADFAIGGNVHGGGRAPIADLGGLNPGLAGVSSTLEIGSRSQSTVYGEAWGIGVELGYGLSDSAEVFGSVRYSSTGSGSTQVGVAVVPALNASLPINGDFGSWNNWAVEAGYRQYLSEGTFRPYVAGRAGLVFSNRINATFTIPDAAITLSDVPFYKPSTLFTGGVDLGAAVQIGTGVSLFGETGIRYTSSPRGDDSALSTLGLASINNDGDRWDVPVRIGIGFTF